MKRPPHLHRRPAGAGGLVIAGCGGLLALACAQQQPYYPGQPPGYPPPPGAPPAPQYAPPGYPPPPPQQQPPPQAQRQRQRQQQQPGYGQQPPGYPSQYPPPQNPQQAQYAQRPGYPPPPAQPGYPPPGQPGYPPPGQPGYPPPGQPGAYPPPGQPAPYGQPPGYPPPYGQPDVYGYNQGYYPPGAYEHDGFYLRMAAGPNIRAGGTTHFGVLDVDLAVGGMVAQNFAIYGDLRVGQNIAGIGPGVAFYLMPMNISFGGQLMLESMDVGLSGFGLQGNFTKEWFVAPQWGIGVQSTLNIVFGRATAVVLGGAFVATFN